MTGGAGDRPRTGGRAGQCSRKPEIPNPNSPPEQSNSPDRIGDNSEPILYNSGGGKDCRPDVRARRRKVITDVRVSRIKTVPMTPTEYADAVEALAVLIRRYERWIQDTTEGVSEQ